MNKKSILITGASGFIGRNLCEYFFKNKMEVIALFNKKITHRFYTQAYKRSLGEPIKDILKKHQIDLIIHAAYTPKSYEKNITGTIIWATEGKEFNVSTQLLLSTITASDNTLSCYGKLKRQLELWFLKNNLSVIRLALVVGDGGFYKRLENLVRKFPIIPVPSKTYLHLTHIDELKLFIEKKLINNSNNSHTTKISTMVYPFKITFFYFFKELANILNLKRLIIPFPSLLFRKISSFLASKRKRCKKVTFIDNLIGIFENSKKDFKNTDNTIFFPLKDEIREEKFLSYLLKKTCSKN